MCKSRYRIRAVRVRGHPQRATDRQRQSISVGSHAESHARASDDWQAATVGCDAHTQWLRPGRIRQCQRHRRGTKIADLEFQSDRKFGLIRSISRLAQQICAQSDTATDCWRWRRLTTPPPRPGPYRDRRSLPEHGADRAIPLSPLLGVTRTAKRRWACRSVRL